LLAALTVFPAGFDLACACVLAHDEGWDVPLLLDELVMHSLVNRRASPRPEGAEAKPESACADDAPPRFTLYQPIREFAAQQLDAAAAARWRARLRRWAVQWAAALPRTPPLAALREEMPNLVAALASALHDDEPTAAIEMLLALRRALEDVELPAEGLRLACLLVEREPDRRLAARGHTALGPLLFTAGQSEAALQHADRGLACDGLDAMQRARALHAAARVRLRSRFEVERVEPMLDEAERLLGPAPGVAGGAAAPAPDELELRASLLALRAFVFNRLHRRLAEGERLHERALALWERTGNQHAIASGRYNLAVCAQNADRHQDALDRLAPVIESARALGDRRRLSQSLNVRGNAHSGLHQWAEAVADYRECIAVAWRDLSSYDLAYGLWNLPRALLRLRRPEQAVPLAAYADLYWRTHFGALHDEDQRYLRRLRRLASRLVGEPRRQALAREGERLTLAEAVALALA
jgi:tetratricopeptide (TPR) repeat protein